LRFGWQVRKAISSFGGYGWEITFEKIDRNSAALMDNIFDVFCKGQVYLRGW